MNEDSKLAASSSGCEHNACMNPEDDNHDTQIVHITKENMDDDDIKQTFEMVKEMKRLEWFKKMGDLAKEPGTETLGELLQRIDKILNAPKDPEPECDNLLNLEQLTNIIDYMTRQSEYLYQVIFAYKQLKSLLTDVYAHNKRTDIKEDQKLDLLEQ